MSKIRSLLSKLGIGRKAQKPTPVKSAKKETYVFLTAKGKRFHYDPDCSSLRGAKPIKMDISKARKAGYTACEKCCYPYLHI